MAGGHFTTVSASNFSIAMGKSVSVTGKQNSIVLGNNLTASYDNTLHVNNLFVSGQIYGYVGGGGATVVVSGSAPSGSSTSGSLWWNNEDGNLYIQSTIRSGSSWVPAVSSVAGGNYGATYRNSYSASVWTVVHNLGTKEPIVQVYSGSQVMIPASIVSADTTTSIITFAGIVSGSVVASTGIGGPTSSSFALSSVSSVSASFATTASAFIGTQAEYLFVRKSTSQTFALSYNNITNFATPTVNTLVTSSWNGTTGIFTAGRTATYRVGGSFIVNSAADGVGDIYSLVVLKNANLEAEQIHTVYSTAATFKSIILTPSLISVVAGDTLRFQWYQSINANRTNTDTARQNYITIEELPTRIQR
jgi:hypothetical protein